MFFRGKDNCFPINSRIMTNAIAESIVRKDFPLRADGLLEITPFTFKSMVDYIDVPDLPCLMLVRDPIEKVRSALAFAGLTAQHVIDCLKSGEEFHNMDHFRRQSDYVYDCEAAKQPLTCFRYPDQIHLFQEAAKFVTPFMVLNETTYEKPVLSKAEEKFFKEYYAEDILLYNSILA